MRVALISSAVGSQCGIAEHSSLLIQHVQAADPAIEISANAEWLDPDAFDGSTIVVDAFDVVHLNYHRGLHSRWTPEKVRRNIPHPVIITFHDTYERQPDLLPWDLLACPNVRAMIVHEPCDLSGDSPLEEHHLASTVPDLVKKVHFWRQACPPPNGRGWEVRERLTWQRDGWRPTLGTLGFDFPWKNYDLLAQVTGELGWNLHVVGKVDERRIDELRGYNPRTTFAGFAPKASAVAHLAACDATAFLYTCGNSGTSGAIRVGITAGKPLFALRSCRQNRDLLREFAIRWLDSPAQLAAALLQAPLTYDTALIALAHQESWTRQGAQYAALYAEVAASRG